MEKPGGLAFEKLHFFVFFFFFTNYYEKHWEFQIPSRYVYQLHYNFFNKIYSKLVFRTNSKATLKTED